MHLEARYFVIFQKIFGTTKNFQIAGMFFQVLLSTIFYQGSGTFNETFLILSSLAYNIFSKNSWFPFLGKSQVQKCVNIITCFFCTVKKQKFRSIHSWNPSPLLFPVVSFSKCLICVFFVYIHHLFTLVLLHLMNRYTTSTSE